MRYVTASFPTGRFLVGILIAINGLQVSHRIDAQDIGKGPISKSQQSQPVGEKSVTNTFGWHSDRPYPTLSVDEVLDRLTKSTEELIQKKVVKGADELRKNLDRVTFSIALIPALSKELSTQEVYRRTSESVFLVAGMTKPTEKDADWKTSFSTAFVVHEDGILSTSAHVFDHDDHDDAVVAMDIRGNVYPVVEVLAANRKADTLLFRIGAKGLKPIPLGQEVAPGSPVRVMGHPGDSFFFFSSGHLANYERDEDNNSWLNVTADFGQGSSGGPVMDEAGNVIGQVSRTYTLYASGDSSNRSRRRSSLTQKANDADAKEKNTKDADDESDPEAKKKSDPQMVFKACTPVSAIRALLK
jgi:S1-C subfamily serine protease